MNGLRLASDVPVWRLQRFEERIETLEVLLPERAIGLEPVHGLAEGARVDPARPPLRITAAGDEAGALQHFQVLGNRRLADDERFGELGHRRFS